MKEHGQLRVCNRCGTTTFEKHVKTTDAGFKFIYEFKSTEGWTDKEGFGDLCPACTEELESLHAAFLAGKPIRMEGTRDY